VVDLVAASEVFAADLAEIVNATVSADVEFVVTPQEGFDVVWVWPAGSSPRRPALIPIVTTGAPIRLWLKVEFKMRPDEVHKHLAVETSVFSLVIDEATVRPAVRMEYDRGRGSEPDDETLGRHRRSAAHVQIHGSSEELAYVQALTGRPLRRLDQFHIPVGGRRFRPALEDFIEFLRAEELVILHDGWHDVIQRHRERWLTKQLRAAVRNEPESAIAELMEMGYDVSQLDKP
jgi:hypothetical protein